MKKLILITGMVVATVVAEAQTFRAQSFLAQGVASLYVTNLVAITNLNTAGANTTNAPGTAWSNYTTGVSSPYTLYVVGTNTGSGTWTNATKNLLKDVDLWCLKDGSGAWSTGLTNGDSGTLNYPMSYATLSIRIATAGSGANTAAALVFTPLYGPGSDAASATGLNPRPTAVEGDSGDEWTVGITSAGATQVVVTTNAPLFKWQGARGLRLRRITHTDADASSQIIVNDISLNGYVP